MRLAARTILLFVLLLGCQFNIGAQQDQLLIKEVFLGNDIHQPIEIVKFNKGEGDDWLKDLSIEIKNVSQEPICYFRYAMVIRKPNPKDTPIGYQFVFNEEIPQLYKSEIYFKDDNSSVALKPGQTTVIKLSEEKALWLKKALTQKGISLADIKKVDFILQVVTYDGKRYWSGGSDHISKPTTECKTDDE